MHLSTREISKDSHIILTFGSVPEGLTNNLPLFLINLFAALMAFLHLIDSIIFLSFPLYLRAFAAQVDIP